MVDLPARLGRLGPTIERIMAIGGTPGLSLGVFTKNNAPYYANYGFRDVEKQLKVTEDTVFPVCSLTKALTAAALGLLVDEKKVTWDTLVKDALPDFKSRDDTLQNNATITDILSHRTGMGWADNLIIGTDANILISSKDMVKYVNDRPRQLPFRGQFAYNNLHYEIAGRIIEAVSGQSYYDFVKARILDPLGMHRTFLKTPSANNDAVSLCYNALDDATAAPITCPKLGDDWYGAPSGGLRSTASDLGKLYTSFISAFNDQFHTGQTSTEGNPLKQVAHLLSAKIPLDQPSKLESSYALGWARVQLPGKLGQIGLNPGLLPQGMPLIGQGGASQLLIFHQGSLPGALAFVGLLPESETAVVVLSNSLALNDAADWVGHLVLEELLGVPGHQRNDYPSLAEAAVKENLKWYPALTKELDEGRKGGAPPRPLEEYTGTYWDHLHVVKIDVTLEDGQLYWLIQGLQSEKFPLAYYADNTFTWLLPRNELSRRGRWVGSDQEATFWKANFELGDNGKISKLSWAHDGGVPPIELTKV